MDNRHFFVSRSGQDEQETAWLLSELSRLGYSYHEQSQWPPGTNFIKAMSDAIGASNYTLCLFSSAYFAEASEATEQEWTAALRKARLIGVMIEVVDIPEILTPSSYIDLARTRSIEERETKLATELAKLKLPRDGEPWVPPMTGVRRLESEAAIVPFLCDRETEELTLTELLAQREQGRPVIVIVHGDEEQAPEGFRHRVERVSVLMHLKTPVPPRVRGIPITWPATRDTATFSNALARLQQKHMLTGYAPEDAIVVGTELIVEQWFGSELTELVDAYVRFWCDADIGRGCLLIVCLAVRYRAKSWRNWLAVSQANRHARNAVAALKAAAHERGCIVLGPLESVPLGQVRNWRELPEVQRIAFIDGADVDALYNGGLALIPMKKLIPRLRKLLKTKASGRKG